MRLSCEHRSIAFENTLSRCSTPANGITGRVKGKNDAFLRVHVRFLAIYIFGIDSS